MCLRLCEWCRREGEDVRKNEAVAVDPVGVLGVEGHELVEQDVGHGGHAHGGTRVARVGLEGGIDLQSGGGSAIEAEEVDGSCWGRQNGRGGADCGGGGRDAGQVGRTARVRMVLMASSSTFPYGMMGRWTGD